MIKLILTKDFYDILYGFLWIFRRRGSSVNAEKVLQENVWRKILQNGFNVLKRTAESHSLHIGL